MIDSLMENLRQSANEYIRRSCEVWVNAYVEKELLPRLVDDIKSRITIEMIEMAPDVGIEFRVRLRPKL